MEMKTMAVNRFRTIFTIFAFILVLAVPSGVLSVMAQSQQGAPAQNAGSSAQPAGTAAMGPQSVIEVVHVKYADVHHLLNLLNFFSVPMRADPTLKVISLAGPLAQVAAVEEAIKQLDVPPPPVEDIVITGYLLTARGQATTETTIVPGGSWIVPEPAGSTVPPQLEEVINQLKRVLNYKDFVVVDVLTLRTVNYGSARVSGLTPIARSYHPQISGGPRLGSNVQAQVSFTIDEARIARGEGTSWVSLRGMRLLVVPEAPHSSPAVISTDIDVGQNQQVVVGKTDVLSPDHALFLVITAQITH
jgi:hypothetical protein